MAEPMKNSYGPDVPKAIAASIVAVYADFDTKRFLKLALDGYEDLELTPRGKQIATALGETLPADRTEAMEILLASFGPVLEGDDLGGIEGFFYMPHGYFVAEFGLDDFDSAMRFQAELTKRFTAEFSIRAFWENHPEQTLAQAHEWTADPDEHVRRLVSEGSRPRLPWSGQLKAFIADPAPVVELLEKLKNDPSEYVRRSVANNLNDIAKDHPDVVVATARRWWPTANADERRMIRHGLRSLIKAGNLDALDILGFGPSSPAKVVGVVIEPNKVAIGEKVRVSVTLSNPSTKPAGALVDLVVHFVKADGSTSPKVFKGKELQLAPGDEAEFAKSISVAQHSTRKHYPGEHVVEVQLNGAVVPGASFTLT